MLLKRNLIWMLCLGKQFRKLEKLKLVECFCSVICFLLMYGMDTRREIGLA